MARPVHTITVKDVPVDGFWSISVYNAKGYLFATKEGHILFNTGMPESGPIIVASMRTLGFDAKDIKQKRAFEDQVDLELGVKK